jgi:predicted nucleic-acid-binding protein
MTGVDTNVLVRYIMQDDAKQAPIATRFIEALTAEDPGFVPLVCVVELAWVLSSAYGLARQELVQAFETILRTKELVIERAEIVWRAVRAFHSSNADFADCMISHSAHSFGCEMTMTFDRAAAKTAGMTLLV